MWGRGVRGDEGRCGETCQVSGGELLGERGKRCRVSVGEM